MMPQHTVHEYVFSISIVITHNDSVNAHLQQYLIDLYLLNGCVNNIRLLTVMHIVYGRVISLRRGQY